ncbi:MAG: NIPSNAP family protein [Burkholderiales bacterium]
MPTPTEPRHPVVELRQYTLHPGQRDTLIELFDREFIETQEAVGMAVLCQFRDLDDPDRFVWLRGFQGMAARAEALAAFYDGPVWRAHRDAANATMLDSDNVLLLRPASTHTSMPIDAWRRGTAPAGAAVALVCPLTAVPDAHVVAALLQAWLPLLARHGGTLAGCWVSENSANSFPRLPVREGEQVLVALARFGEREGCDRFATALKASPDGFDRAGADTGAALIAPAQVLRLAPTTRSRF